MVARPTILVSTMLALAAMGWAAALQATGAPVSEADRHFLEFVQPLLESHCISCHSAAKIKGGLRLDSREAALKGGNSGPAVVPGKPEQSLLLSTVMHKKKDMEMPPKEKLSARDIAVLERWIREGAPWPDAMPPAVISSVNAPLARVGDAWSDKRNPIVRIFGGQRLDLWSLQPVHAASSPPTIKTLPPASNGIDRFVLADMKAAGIEPAPPADARTLARRLHFDLTGLPPTEQEVAEFRKSVARDGTERAASALADSLLASPRFGEHFARMWLDVVRYSDSNGFDWDEFRPQAWRFRDYVIRSFNADKRFDDFIREQLAGDELVNGAPHTPAERDKLIATGFLRLGPHDNAAGLFKEQDRSRAELLADLTETTGGSFLGLTMTCCRCHDHKYDPLSQADHYRLRAFFAGVKFADDLPLDLDSEQKAIHAHNAEIQQQLAKTDQLVADGIARAKQRVADTRPKGAAISDADAMKAFTPQEKAAHEALIAQRDAQKKELRPFTFGLCMTDDAKSIPVIHILFQGDHKTEREAVVPGFPSALDPNPATIASSPNPQSSGRRLALANWIASTCNPLTARVYVNRVWQLLMGRPLVATPNDFGFAGSRPQDAALLDWLAAEFIRGGWSTKSLVRVIASSAAYRQAPCFGVEHFGLRQPRRLTAEQLRDSLLQVSNLLTAKTEGPPIWPTLPQEVLDANPSVLDDNKEKTKGWYPSPHDEQFARSVFMIQKRNTRVPFLETFDLPDNSTPCPRRVVSTVPPQALSMLNSPLATEAALALEQRVKKEAGPTASADGQISRAFALTLQREPDEDELAACRKLLARRSLADLCRALLNLNEFAYLD